MLADNIKKTPEKLVMKMWIELYWVSIGSREGIL
jgi:hypothetical protein